MKSERVRRIVDALNDNKITAYEVSQKTSLTTFAIQKIKDGESKNPRNSSLDEIESFLESRLSIDKLPKKNNVDISKLAIDVYKNWDRLIEEDIFREKIDNLVKDKLILRLQDIINKKN